MAVFLQNTGGSIYEFGSSGYTSMGLVIHSGHVLIGESVTQISWFLKRATNSGDGGPIKAKIYSGMNPLTNNPTLVATSINSIDADTLTGTVAQYDFNFSGYTISNGDMITMSADDTNNSTTVSFDNDDGSGMTNAAEARTANEWTTYEAMIGAQPRIQVTYTAPTTSGTRLPPPRS